MPTRLLRLSARRFPASFALVCLSVAQSAGAEPDFSGVWGMVQHDRLGAPFFIPIEPKAAALRAKLSDCTESMHRSIENRHDDLYLDPGAAAVLFVSRYRAMPGRTRDYMSFVRSEMYPVMKQAQDDGTFAGLSVTTSVQGGEPGIITLNMHYKDFAPLDGPPPVAKTLGPEGTAAFLAKGAGLITQLDQSILRRVPDLSF